MLYLQLWSFDWLLKGRKGWDWLMQWPAVAMIGCYRIFWLVGRYDIVDSIQPGNLEKIIEFVFMFSCKSMLELSVHVCKRVIIFILWMWNTLLTYSNKCMVIVAWEENDLVWWLRLECKVRCTPERRGQGMVWDRGHSSWAVCVCAVLMQCRG